MAFDYRTVFEPGLMVITRVTPVALPGKERKTIYRRKGENFREVVASNERQRTLAECNSLGKMSQRVEGLRSSSTIKIRGLD